ncbi:MAG: hypothetical protein P4L53_25280 [Candidatus Obscuribacterales bacterium]|nr:hypothetical protein [Candidatus Obscuribacterales bacterium]
MSAASKIDNRKGRCVLLSFQCLLLASWALALSAPYAQGTEKNDSAGDTALTSTTSKTEQKDAVVDWFKKYDQIRRDAELNFLEKFQTMSFWDKNVDHAAVLRKRDQELVERMSAKYSRALEEMRNLPEVSATKELQDGYIDYFDQVHQIFTAYLKSATAEEAPSSHSTMRERRSALEELDLNNKKLDGELRQKFGIARHRHS